MIALLQRVSQARVDIAERTVGQIGQGLLVFLGIERDDSPSDVEKLAQRVVSFRLFSDANDKMNLSVGDIGGSVLVVSQFTLAADTRSGRRPSFSSAAPPEQAEPLYQQFVAAIAKQDINVATGEFGGDMQVSLTNAGPVTFLLHSKGKQ